MRQPQRYLTSTEGELARAVSNIKNVQWVLVRGFSGDGERT
jgi:hypothetical protein